MGINYYTIFRNLKSTNVLLDISGNIKLTDINFFTYKTKKIFNLITNYASAPEIFQLK